MTTLFLKNKATGTRVGLAISLAGHSAALLAVLFCFTSRPPSSAEVIPISAINVGDAENGGRQSSFNPEMRAGSIRSKSRAVEQQTQVSETQISVSHASDLLSGGSSNIPEREEARVEPQDRNLVAGVQSQPESFLWHAGQAAMVSTGSTMSQERDGQLPAPTITRSTDWHGHPVEVDTLTYSVPGSPLKWTMQKAYSGGFAGSTFSPGFRTNSGESAAPLGLAPSLNSDTTMVSRRLDLTVVNSGNFGVTAFGYSSEAGGGFKPFGAQSNLPKAGTRTMKAGGQLRAGPFSFGFAESGIENTQPLSFGLEDSNIENIDNVAQLAAVQQELSATLDLPQLVGSQVSTGFFSTLLPTLWVASNDQHTLASGQGSVSGGTSTTSFGGSWTWNHGYASLGYWNYAGNEGAAASAWSGSGLDASFGGYYSSFGIDVSLSYGGSADIAPAWQSAGALYNSSVTVSYKPESPNLPDIWASAAAGNYNQNSIAYGGTSSAFSDMYDMSTKGEYWSIATGLDLTRFFWTRDTSASGALTGEHPSFKLLYQYTDGLYLDSSGSAGTTRSVDNLVAVMIRRRF